MAKQQYRFLVFIVVMILASVYSFVFSKSGFLERLNLEKGHGRILARIENLKSEKNNLQHTLQGYKEGKFSNKDFLESGYIKSGDRIIFFNDSQKKIIKQQEKVTDAEFFTYLPYLRVLWAVFSAVVLAGLIMYARRNNDTSASNFDL